MTLGNEHNFTLMNHTYEIDWLVGWVVIDRFATLGNARGFVKNVIKYIPIAGWFFGLAEHIFLQRNFDKDKTVIENRIKDIMNYPDTAWPVMTAEGTRFTKAKHDASIKFAKEKGIEALKHHLIPRAKGFITCVPIMKKYNCPAVLNVQLTFHSDEQTKPTLANLLRGKKVVAHVYIERIPMAKVEATSEYLQKIYREKDELQESFLNYGNFYEGRNQKPIEGVKMKPRLCVLINSICWMTFNFSLMLYYAISLILKGKFIFLITVSGGIIALCKLLLILCCNNIKNNVIINVSFSNIVYVLMQKIINASKVNKGSHYGKSQ